jgi:serine/threonine protein kinase
MLFKEVSALKNLNHPNILKIINCYTLKPEMKMALVLEFLKGGDLN